MSSQSRGDRRESQPAPRMITAAIDRFLAERLAGWPGPAALYLTTVAILLPVPGRTMMHQSTDPHFVVLADAWLHGRTDVTPPPGHSNDWAHVTMYDLKSGHTIVGRPLTTKVGRFRTTDGHDI